ncbi:unnamed protein product [Mycena citricolor]|uniref:Uncharacterized protein n=1 Tax=Mycena citricolor TaxID=2018698 RepID=A0AAD2GRW2_9AGAR|nr:unnamed protein product [Mycena citricolor]
MSGPRAVSNTRPTPIDRPKCYSLVAGRQEAGQAHPTSTIVRISHKRIEKRGLIDIGEFEDAARLQ